jgi:hypothetical protein
MVSKVVAQNWQANLVQNLSPWVAKISIKSRVTGTTFATTKGMNVIGKSKTQKSFGG